MTMAKNFISIVNGFQYAEDGKKEVPEDLIPAWREKASTVEFPLGRDSLDATEVWRFPDGSAVWVDNPRQRCYALSASVTR